MNIVNKTNEDDGILNNFIQLLSFYDTDETYSFSLIINGILTMYQQTELSERIVEATNVPEWQVYDVEQMATKVLTEMGYTILKNNTRIIYF